MGILTKDAIEKGSTLFLRCSKIASDPTTPEDAATKARKLCDDWSSLKIQTQPQSPTEKREWEAQLVSLNERMESFLRTIE
jgi:hypothetical protein